VAKREKLGVTVWTQKMLQQKKFGALMAVAAGSEQEPRMVVLKYKAPKATQTIALVGKGVTFDSGGLNLKSAAGIGAMKIDMAGAAAVAATLITAARLKPAVNLIGVIPIVENMPSGHAYRPGDVITSYTGKTIEIGNTDAEGRLILADALAYTVKAYRPDVLIDLATLTGACMVALGDKIAGVFSKDDVLAEAIVKAGEQTFERCWQMPLPDDYREFIKSDLADIQNMSKSKYGGAITAALFLSEFVGEARWAHIDIAGPALNEKAGDYCPVGGSGFGVRLLWTLINSL
jgi:leucyl aminopeptidase